MNNKMVIYSLWAVAAALIVIGLKFTSVGVGPGHVMQDDGYNVTGGLLMLFGGVIVGMLISAKQKK